MRILFPLEVPTCHPGNPYVLQLMDALIHERGVSYVGSGCASLYWPKPRWDVIHIQWPEALVGWEEPNSCKLETLRSALKRAKRHASIVVTIHNYHPKEWPLGRELYQSVYKYADAFVHLGERSLDWFLEKNKDKRWCAAAIHEVIEHGEYSFYEGLPQENNALVRHLALSDKVYLVFGSIWKKEELTLAENAFQIAGLSCAKLMFARLIRFNDNNHEQRHARHHPDIIRSHKSVPDGQVKPLIRASDFVFVPRIGRLNSGVLALAFTYDTPVIGPDEGVMGEMIKATDNISFSPGNANSSAEAFRIAYSLSDEQYRAMSHRAREYREKHMHWPDLAKQHVILYKRTRRLSHILRSRFGRSLWF